MPYCFITRLLVVSNQNTTEIVKGILMKKDSICMSYRNQWSCQYFINSCRVCRSWILAIWTGNSVRECSVVSCGKGTNVSGIRGIQLGPYHPRVWISSLLALAPCSPFFYWSMQATERQCGREENKMRGKKRKQRR